MLNLHLELGHESRVTRIPRWEVAGLEMSEIDAMILSTAHFSWTLDVMCRELSND